MDEDSVVKTEPEEVEMIEVEPVLDEDMLLHLAQVKDESEDYATGEGTSVSSKAHFKAEKDYEENERYTEQTSNCININDVLVYSTDYEKKKTENSLQSAIENSYFNYNLSLHFDTRADGRNRECPICYKWIRKDILPDHMRLHTGEKPYQCLICQKFFRRKTQLTNHSKIHSVDKPFECSVCQQRFKTKCYLTKHARIHTGEKPFECTLCGKRFGRQDQLIPHSRIHTGEKPYQCYVCEKRFKTNTEMNKHFSVHKGKSHACPVCSKRFARQDNLFLHSKVHAKEKIEYALNSLKLNTKISVKKRARGRRNVFKQDVIENPSTEPT